MIRKIEVPPYPLRWLPKLFFLQIRNRGTAEVRIKANERVKAVRTPFRLWRSRVGSQRLVIIRCADQSGCSMFESGWAPLHGPSIIAANGFNDLIRYPRKLFLFWFFFSKWFDQNERTKFVSAASLPSSIPPTSPSAHGKLEQKKTHFWFITLFFYQNRKWQIQCTFFCYSEW